jgi:chromosome partitioning protein
MGKVVAIVNDKGGVGKSTTAINLAAGLALRTRRLKPEKKFAVLTIDLDPSTVTTLSSIHSNAYETPDSARSIVELFRIKPPAEPTREFVSELLKAFVRPSEYHENLWYVPTHRAELRELIKHGLVQMPNREVRLARILKLFRWAFDYIVIDTPPFGEEITNNALLAADCVLVPVNGSNLATRGLIEAVGRIKVLEAEFDRRIPVLGIVATDINDDSTARAVLAELEAQFPGGILQVVRHSADVAAAHSQHMDIFTYRPIREGAAQNTGAGSSWWSESYRSSREFGALVEKVAQALEAEQIANVA